MWVKNKIDIIERYKENIPSVFFIFGVVLIYAIFPIENNLQQILLLSTLFLGLPYIYSRLFLNNGFIKTLFGDIGKNLLYSFYFSFPVLFCSILLFYVRQFTEKYIPIDFFNEDIQYVILNQAGYIFLLSFIISYFFIGFVYFKFEEILGSYKAIFVSWLLLLLIVIINIKSFWITLPYLIFFPIAGLIAKKTRTYFYSAVFYWLFIMAFNLAYFVIVK